MNKILSTISTALTLLASCQCQAAEVAAAASADAVLGEDPKSFGINSCLKIQVMIPWNEFGSRIRYHGFGLTYHEINFLADVLFFGTTANLAFFKTSLYCWEEKLALQNKLAIKNAVSKNQLIPEIFKHFEGNHSK